MQDSSDPSNPPRTRAILHKSPPDPPQVRDGVAARMPEPPAGFADSDASFSASSGPLGASPDRSGVTAWVTGPRGTFPGDGRIEAPVAVPTGPRLTFAPRTDLRRRPSGLLVGLVITALMLAVPVVLLLRDQGRGDGAAGSDVVGTSVVAGVRVGTTTVGLDPETAGLNGLQARAAADQPVVTRDLGERWVPQVSSKRYGLVAEGITWRHAEILREHEELRARYPTARLLWSGAWSTFSYSDFWITVIGIGFPTAGGAISWCAGHGFDRDHCYAKLISTTHPVEGSTGYQ